MVSDPTTRRFGNGTQTRGGVQAQTTQAGMRMPGAGQTQMMWGVRPSNMGMPPAAMNAPGAVPPAAMNAPGAVPPTTKYAPTRLASFDPGTVDVTQDPGYDFRMQEGLKAIRRGAAAGSGARGGATMKALTRYGQNLASDEYGKAYDRAVGKYLLDRQNTIDERGFDVQDYRLFRDQIQQAIDNAMRQNVFDLTKYEATHGVRQRDKQLEIDKYGVDKAVEFRAREQKQGQSQQRFNNLMTGLGFATNLVSSLF